MQAAGHSRWAPFLSCVCVHVHLAQFAAHLPVSSYAALAVRLLVLMPNAWADYLAIGKLIRS